MAFSPGSFLRLDSFAAILLGFIVVLSIGFAYARQADERENREMTLARLRALGAVLERVETWPPLSELVSSARIKPEDSKDGWGNDLRLDEKESTVYSLGSDGLPGGEGFCADLRVKVKR